MSAKRGTLGHLARRLATSLSPMPPTGHDAHWAAGWLSEAERDLWLRLSAADQRHSIEVARRFYGRRGGKVSAAEMAGALLHDIGKLEAGLGTLGRVVATAVGPRNERLKRYHDHEQIGADIATAAGSNQVTVDLIRGVGPAASDLQSADDSI